MNQIQGFFANIVVLLAVGLALSSTIGDVPKTDPPQTTTTTIAPNTTTTVPPSTTTSIPSPPLPAEGSWNITEGNVTCIRAQLQIGFTVTVGEENFNFSLSPNASDEGSSCNVSDTTQQLRLSHDYYVLTFLFEKDGDNAYVKNITLQYTLAGQTNTVYSDSKLFGIRVGNSYLCKTTDVIPMGSATMDIYRIRLEAFGNSDEDDFGTTQECEADDAVNDTIVIAVACALAGLIIIVLVAYLIGRRRSRQRGYTSV